MDTTPRPGEFYRHFKDKLYQVLTVAEHTETGEPLVVYQALYGSYSTYARPLAMFTSEVDHEKYPNVTQKDRFEKVVLTYDKEAAGTDFDSPDHTAAVQEYTLNPNLLAFIETKSYDGRMECLRRMKGKIVQEDLDIIYVALDMQRPSGTLEDQIHVVEQHIRLLETYDGGRLR